MPKDVISHLDIDNILAICVCNHILNWCIKNIAQLKDSWNLNKFKYKAYATELNGYLECYNLQSEMTKSYTIDSEVCYNDTPSIQSREGVH